MSKAIWRTTVELRRFWTAQPTWRGPDPMCRTRTGVGPELMYRTRTGLGPELMYRTRTGVSPKLMCHTGTGFGPDGPGACPRVATLVLGAGPPHSSQWIW